MERESNRLQSFYDQDQQWPHNEESHPQCTPAKLAAAGFVFVPTENYTDLCQCHFCGLRLRDWDSTDVPLEEHRRHKPDCPFIVNPSSTNNISASNLQRKLGLVEEDEDDLGFNLFDDDDGSATTESNSSSVVTTPTIPPKETTVVIEPSPPKEVQVTEEMQLRGQFISNVLFSLINPQNEWNFDMDGLGTSTSNKRVVLLKEKNKYDSDTSPTLSPSSATTSVEF